MFSLVPRDFRGLPLAASRLEMLQWDRVKHLNFESFCAAYNYYMHKGIAIEIREHLSAWIESNFLYSNFDPENPEHFERISLLCTDFFNEIKRVVQNLTAANHDITIRLNLLSSLSNLQKLCHLDLYRRMRDCLLEERRLLQLESTSQRSSTQGAPNNTLEVSEQLDSIVRLRNQYTLSVEHLRVLKTELRTLLQMRNETQLNISQLGSGAIFKGANPGQYFADKLENENGRIGTTTSLVLEHEAHCLEQVQVLVNNLEGAVHSLDKHFLQLIKWSQPSTDAPLDTVDTWYPG
ncbi:unnamed protein product [Allacma fusca]|uniref:STAT transcription factor protein interaction domain-containing protein n=1 Tax=Allacma fusca TaxID=39272 RepID=A0A8J2KWC0_9HEXA|nr:unnamed protein product [Allacma fusca]